MPQQAGCKGKTRKQSERIVWHGLRNIATQSVSWINDFNFIITISCPGNMKIPFLGTMAV